MNLIVNEIFESIQGEGFHTGQLAIFVRFSGCNMKCSFCDTKYAWNSDNYAYKCSPEELVEVIRLGEFKSDFIVLTGGEPLVQNFEALCEFVRRLKEAGYYVALETNGSFDFYREALEVDWLTVSPKNGMLPNKKAGEELKLVYTGEETLELYESLKFKHFYLQPCLPEKPLLAPAEDEPPSYVLGSSYGEAFDIVLKAIKKHRRWKVSFQTHKLVGWR